MIRPDTVPDVLALVRRSRLVEDARLAEFLALFQCTQLTGLDSSGILSLMVERGLLTRYQASELAVARWWGFWIGGYRVLDRLGRGGMGTVFLAEHALLGKRVAVKVLAGGLQADHAARGRFLREARAAAALDHPNIVHVYHADVDNDPPYMVMEYVDGISLQAAVARHGVLAPGEAATVGVGIAQGLVAAAAAELIHRDIKPANLLVDRKGQVKVLDLGIARFTCDPDSQLVDRDMIVGTIDYLAPEQAEDGSRVDPRADQYALGATLYFLLTGQPPFVDGEVSRKLYRKQHTDPIPLHHLRGQVPPGLSAVVQRMLARDPEDRFPHPAAVVDALMPWAEVGPDFPDRLFQPWTTLGADGTGEATDPGRDHDPTPLPATICFTRPRTGLTPHPDIPPRAALVVGEVNPPAAEPDEDETPTVRLTRPEMIRLNAWHLIRNWLRTRIRAAVSILRQVLNPGRKRDRADPADRQKCR